MRQCQCIKFSDSGSQIAASSGSAVVIVDLYSGDIISTLRGHVSKIKSISWMHLDSQLCTVGSEGAIFYWDVFNGIKRPESLNTPLHVVAGASFRDRSKAFLATPEKVLREFVVVPPVDTEVVTDKR